jgi:hypothetical protein
VERWAAPQNGEMAGSSRTFIGGAPRESERLRLFVRGDTFVYNAHPSGQQPTEFRAPSITDRELRFSNSAHDFPQHIVYERVGSDSLIARIEGDRAGRRAPVSYPFRRVECVPDTPTPSETARAELEPLYEKLREREKESGGGTNAWLADHAAPGFQYLMWTASGTQPAVATPEMLARAAAASRTNPASLALSDRTHALTIERLHVRGDTVAVLVTVHRSWKFPDTNARFGPAGEMHERRAVERRMDTWVKLSGAWRLKESSLIGDEVHVDGKLTQRDGRAVPPS